MTKFIARAYNSFEVNRKTRASIFKRSQEVRLKDEINYYLNLPDSLRVFFPRLISSDTNSNPFEMELEYYAYSNLGISAANGESVEFWGKTFNSIGLFLDNCSNYSSFLCKTDSESMFIKKTELEYKKLISNFDYFNNLSEYSELFLNGNKLKPIDKIWPKIRKFIETSLFSEKGQIIHGDLCFSNILFGQNPINQDLILKFIDPRGTFGTSVLFGDVYYDLAKLSHSCNGGYEYFTSDRFSVFCEENSCDLVFINDLRKNSKSAFSKFAADRGYNALKIKTLEGLIFVGMCARHYDSLDRQKAMFFTGLNLLNEVYEAVH